MNQHSKVKDDEKKGGGGCLVTNTPEMNDYQEAMTRKEQKKSGHFVVIYELA